MRNCGVAGTSWVCWTYLPGCWRVCGQPVKALIWTQWTLHIQRCRISLYMRISKDANLTLGKNMEHWLNEEMELHD